MPHSSDASSAAGAPLTCSRRPRRLVGVLLAADQVGVGAERRGRARASAAAARSRPPAAGGPAGRPSIVHRRACRAVGGGADVAAARSSRCARRCAGRSGSRRCRCARRRRAGGRGGPSRGRAASTGTCVPSSIFSASSRAVISSTPLPVTISRSHAGERARRRQRSASRWASVLVDHARSTVVRVGGAGDRGAARAAARRSRRCGTTTCRAAASRSTSRRPSGASGVGAVISDRARAVARGPHRGERRRACPPRARPRSARRRACGSSGPRRRRARRARPSSAAPAIAACSLVPQPVSDDRSRASRIDSAASSAAGDAEDRRHEARLGQDHLLHRPRRARRAAPACRSWPRTVPCQWPVRQGHFDADEPGHFGALRAARPRAPGRCAPSSRMRSAPRSPAAALRPAPGCPPRASLAEALARLPRRRQRGVRRRSPPKAGSRSAAAPPRSSAPSPPRASAATAARGRRSHRRSDRAQRRFAPRPPARQRWQTGSTPDRRPAT